MLFVCVPHVHRSGFHLMEFASCPLTTSPTSTTINVLGTYRRDEYGG